MPETLAVTAALAAVLAMGSLIQSAAGFGFALFTVPLLVVLGCRPDEAIVLVAVSASGNAIVGVTLLRAHVSWRRVLGMVVLASISMPLGVAVLELLAHQDRTLVRRVFGAIVLAAVVMQLALRIKPRERLPGGAMVGAMLASGFMGGLSGMSGPPAVLWVMSHRWSNPESRATLWAFFGGTTPIQLLLLWRAFGEPVVASTLLGVALVPATVLGMLPGLWIGHRISKPRLRAVGFGILILIATYALVGP